MNEQQRQLLRILVDDLVERNVVGIVESGRAGRLTGEEIQGALADYPGSLTEVPGTEFAAASYFPRKGSEDVQGSAEINLWVDSKESDLTLLVDFEKTNQEWKIAIDDIHVL